MTENENGTEPTGKATPPDLQPVIRGLGDPKVVETLRKMISRMNDAISRHKTEDLGPPDVAQRLLQFWQEGAQLEVLLRRVEFARAQYESSARSHVAPQAVAASAGGLVGKSGSRLVIPGQLD